MALTRPRDAVRPSPPIASQTDDAVAFELNDFEAELQRLSAANQELLAEFDAHEGEEESLNAQTALAESDELAMLRMENAELKSHIQQLEAAMQNGAGQSEDVWLERQHEYEMLLEEKSEVIRTLHQKIQELQDQAGPAPTSAPVNSGMGQAEELPA